jgi:hypothetical protein
MGLLKGFQCKLMHNSGTFGTPVWAESDAVRNATLDVGEGEVDASSRASGGWKLSETTLSEATLNVTFVKEKTDASFVAIESAAKAKTALELAALDGPDGVGTDYLDAMWKAFSWNETQDLEGILIIEAVFKPCPDADLSPTWGTGALPTSRP